MDAVGVNWVKKDGDLPDLINGEKVKFDLALRPSMAKYCEDNNLKNEDEKVEDEEEGVDDESSKEVASEGDTEELF